MEISIEKQQPAILLLHNKNDMLMPCSLFRCGKMIESPASE
jgi:hypothetical protein